MTWNRSVSQYVTTARGEDGSPHYVMGDLTQRTASLTTRLQYIFSPGLSLQLYAQPFISAGDYTRFWEGADPRAASFENRFRRLADGQLSSEDGRYKVDRDGDGSAEYAFGAPGRNVFLLKVEHWLGL